MRLSPSSRYLLALGLLLLTSPLWLQRLYPLSDGAKGFLAGVGLGLELWTLWRARRPTS